jgi:hypothetical protein
VSELAWPIATVLVAAIAGRCAFLALRIRGDAAHRAEERHERAAGVMAVVDTAREEMRAAHLEMKTFIANNRGRNG